MKISSSLLQAITLGISVTTIAATMSSCEIAKVKTELESPRNAGETGEEPVNTPDPCPMCGMG